jgi:hypothetical protein
MTETAPVAQSETNEPVSDDAISQDVALNVAPVVGQDAAPLEGAVSFPLTKSISLAQFEAELREASGLVDDDRFATVISGPVNSSEPISKDNPAQLWVLPASVDAATVRKVISGHAPRPDWGITASQQAFNDVREKVLANPEVKLTPTEVRNLVVGVVLQQNAQEAIASGNI